MDGLSRLFQNMAMECKKGFCQTSQPRFAVFSKTWSSIALISWSNLVSNYRWIGKIMENLQQTKDVPMCFIIVSFKICHHPSENHITNFRAMRLQGASHLNLATPCRVSRRYVDYPLGSRPQFFFEHLWADQKNNPRYVEGKKKTSMNWFFNQHV